MSIFNETYNKIKLDINARMFFEGIKTKENPYKKEVKFELSDFDNFYSDIYIIKNCKFKNILSDVSVIVETPEEINFHQPVLDLFLNAGFGQQIMPEHILSKLNENWIYYESYEKRSLKDRIPIYVFQFDFNDDDKIFSMFYYLDHHFRKEDKNKIVSEFKLNCINCKGFVKNLGRAIIFCLNKPCSKQTISHELCHYFQEIIHVIENKNVTNVNSGISELQLSKNDLQYLLNEKEFYPHIYVDMIKDFKKFYYIYYKDTIDFDNYVNLLFENVEKYKEKIMFSNFGFNYLNNMNDSTSLQMLAALKYLNYQYNEVKSKLIDELEEI